METFTLALETGGVGAPSPRELEERLRVVEEKVKRDAREIVEVLRADFPQFIRRQVRERFIGAKDFADSISDSRLKEIKSDVEATGAKVVAELIPPLEDWSIWISGASAVPPPPERRDLQANAEVESRIQRIGAELRALLERHGFPDLREEDFRRAYRLPSWFIAGRLLVSLVESYWRNVEELHAVREALDALRDRSLRKERADRWDAL